MSTPRTGPGPGALERYLAHLRNERRLSPHTLAAYRRDAELLCALAGGRALEGHCVITKGELARPHRPEELEAKFMQLGVPLWGEPVTRRLLQGCLAMEKTADMSRFAQEFDL